MFIKTIGPGTSPLPSTVSDAGGFLQFYSFIQDELLTFEAFLTSYSDSFNSSWNSESVYGRIDPIYTFQNTRRTLNLAFTIPNVASRKGVSGPVVFTMDKINKFFQFLYPGYAAAGNAFTITQAPLVRIKFGNMISNSSTTSVGSAAEDGLLSAITSLTMNPKIEHGFSTLTTSTGQKLIYPNFVDLSMGINAIHEESKFFDGGGSTTDENGETTFLPGKDINMDFPYGGFGLQQLITGLIDEPLAPIDSPDVPPSIAEGIENLDPASGEVFPAGGLGDRTSGLGGGGTIDPGQNPTTPTRDPNYFEDTWEKQEGELPYFDENGDYIVP